MVEPQEVGAVGRRGQQEHAVEDLPGDHLRARAHERRPGPGARRSAPACDQGRPSRPARRRSSKPGRSSNTPFCQRRHMAKPEEQAQEQRSPEAERAVRPLSQTRSTSAAPQADDDVRHDRLLGHVPVEEGREPDERARPAAPRPPGSAGAGGRGSGARPRSREKAPEAHRVDVDVAVAREVDRGARQGLGPAHRLADQEEGDRPRGPVPPRRSTAAGPSSSGTRMSARSIQP